MYPQYQIYNIAKSEFVSSGKNKKENKEFRLYFTAMKYT